MNVSKCKLDGILLIEPLCFRDSRGEFMESYRRNFYLDIGVTVDFPQDNYSYSRKNVLRGLHFTKRNPQAQLLTVLHGRIYDVVVDIRYESPTFGEWFGTELNSDNKIKQIYMPAGFAHGFCVLSEYASLNYKVTHCYDSTDESGLIWDDPDLSIRWPISEPIVSNKDRNNSRFQDFLNELVMKGKHE
jgi:dTDP-4-dehydrorhamnose 3,5-epimerase